MLKKRQESNTHDEVLSKVEEALPLAEIRQNSGKMDTIGLSDEEISRFCQSDENLFNAISEGLVNHVALNRLGDIMMADEAELITNLREDYVNFYAPITVNPYIALAGRGPWIITSHGAVVHDNGGYGMLGAGHGKHHL